MVSAVGARMCSWTSRLTPDALRTNVGHDGCAGRCNLKKPFHPNVSFGAIAMRPGPIGHLRLSQEGGICRDEVETSSIHHSTRHSHGSPIGRTPRLVKDAFDLLNGGRNRLKSDVIRKLRSTFSLIRTTWAEDMTSRSS
jgi:hypothetical protein